MSVLLPTGTYIVTRHLPVQDDHGDLLEAGVESLSAAVPGRVRRNAQGVLLDLDPACWSVAELDPATDEWTEVHGPDVDGTVRTWLATTATLRKGLTPLLNQLSYVEVYAERRDS